jgi:hypothetical protein
MYLAMTPMERLREDLLTDCAAELLAVRQERDDLKFDNACMQLQIRILVCRLKKATGGVT